MAAGGAESALLASAGFEQGQSRGAAAEPIPKRSCPRRRRRPPRAADGNDSPVGRAAPRRDGRRTASTPRARPPAKRPPRSTCASGPTENSSSLRKDAQALDLFEELAAELATPRKEYKVFHLHNASASSVSLDPGRLLQGRAEEEQRQLALLYTGGVRHRATATCRVAATRVTGLSKRRKIKFLPDSDANIILVSGRRRVPTEDDRRVDQALRPEAAARLRIVAADGDLLSAAFESQGGGRHRQGSVPRPAERERQGPGQQSEQRRKAEILLLRLRRTRAKRRRAEDAQVQGIAVDRDRRSVERSGGFGPDVRFSAT